MLPWGGVACVLEREQLVRHLLGPSDLGMLGPLCMLPLHGLPTLTSTDCKEKKDTSKEVVAVVRHAVSEGCATLF